MNPNKNVKKKKATSAPDALPQDPQTLNIRSGTKVPPKVSYCHNCKRNTKSDLYVPYCDKNPLGLASITPGQHGNIIDSMATCDDDYCGPQESTLEEFHELAGNDAAPQEIFARCEVCQYLKQPEPEEHSKAHSGMPYTKPR